MFVCVEVEKNEVNKGEVGKMFLRRWLDVSAISETKFEGKGEVMFGEVVGCWTVEGSARLGVWRGGREGEGRGVTESVVAEVCSRMELRRCHPGPCLLE